MNEVRILCHECRETRSEKQLTTHVEQSKFQIPFFDEGMNDTWKQRIWLRSPARWAAGPGARGGIIPGNSILRYKSSPL
jgi:hypothetical protein